MLAIAMKCERLVFFSLGVVLCVVAAAGCASSRSAESRPEIYRYSVHSDAQIVPERLLARLQEYSRIVLAGSNPWQLPGGRQHEPGAWAAMLAAELDQADARPLHILRESEHAFSWIVEDYVLHRRRSLPPSLQPDEIVFVDAIRQLNQEIAEEKRIHFRYYGSNSRSDSAQLALYAMGVQLQIVPLLVDVLDARPDSLVYETAVRQLQQNLKANEQAYRRELTSVWYDRLKELLQVELKSIAVRRARAAHNAAGSLSSTNWEKRNRERLLQDIGRHEYVEGHQAGNQGQPRFLIVASNLQSGLSHEDAHSLVIVASANGLTGDLQPQWYEEVAEQHIVTFLMSDE